MSTKNKVLIVLVAVLLNLPLLHSIYVHHRVASSGVQVTADLTANSHAGNDYYIEFKVPAHSDVKQITGSAQVDQTTYEVAVRTGQISVRYLPSDPAAYSVRGEVTSRIGLVITILADLVLLMVVFLLSRYRSRWRAVLVLVATEDLERCPPGSVLDRIDGNQYVVCGEVSKIDNDELVLDLGDRLVKVILDGHHNPAGYQEPVRATGQMIA